MKSLDRYIIQHNSCVLSDLKADYISIIFQWFDLITWVTQRACNLSNDQLKELPQVYFSITEHNWH